MDLTFDKVLKVFKDYLDKEDVFEVVMTKRGYTVLAWDRRAQIWIDAQICKTPKDLINALLDAYANYAEYNMTLARRNITPEEKAEIQRQQNVFSSRCLAD